MPERPEEPQTKHSHDEENQLIDDMLDGSDIHELPDQFGQVISDIHFALYKNYKKHDKEAMDQSMNHRRASRFAIGFGTLAILLSLIGVVLEANGIYFRIDFEKDWSRIFWWAEFLFFVAAIVVILIAKKYKHWHKNWLEERFCAENYRSLKFRALLQNSLFCSPEKPWNERHLLWKGWFDGKVLEEINGIKKSVQQCIDGETIPLPPPGTCGCSFDNGYLQDLVNYYRTYRLQTQIDYFDKRFEDLENKDKRFRGFLGGGFYLSIFLVSLNFFINIILKPNSDFLLKIINIIPKSCIDFPLEKINTIILLIMLSLPIIAFSIRTLRSSTEVARSASLYRAKRNALVDFQNRLNIETERNPCNWEEIVKILWECENHFVEVNREWVRIMKEAEWFV